MLLFPELSVNKCAGIDSVNVNRCRTCAHRFRFALNEHSNKIVQCCELQPSKRSNSGLHKLQRGQIVMADIQVTGFINNIKYLPNAVIIHVDEFHKGYKKPNGDIVDDKYLSWKVIFKNGLRNYINNHFNTGMLVTIKGEAFPYAIEKEKLIDGYSFVGQTLNIASYPRSSVKQEQRMMKESQLHSTGVPNLDAYNEPDF